jgi:ubiquinone/menaquinone biosynthesis C-methylase UbiE
VTDDAHLVATRNGYDAIAEQYAEFFRAELDDAPLDRALLRAFAEMVRRDHPDARVVEAGSGPGTVTAHLSQLGLDMGGIDLSPAMVDIARRDHPQIGFRVGDMGTLACADGDLAGLVAWYSLIHAPGPRRQGVIDEFYRVLRPGGYALIAFQVGDDTLHLDEAFGRSVSLDFHRLQPDAVVDSLERAGFELTARVVRSPEATSAASKVPQGTLIARKPSSGI